MSNIAGSIIKSAKRATVNTIATITPKFELGT
jgi:hypothetical protein